VIVYPAAIKWGPAPPSLPPGAQSAVLVGDPGEPGAPFVFRAKVPDGYKFPPHWHPTEENLTVLSGTVLVGDGETFDLSATRELTVGSFVSLPRTMRHYGIAKGETIVQVHGIGPFEINYVNPADDPHRQETKR
jgi:quercetin dioxygenase-like cupin family protein